MVIVKIFNNVTISYENMNFFVHRDIMEQQCTKQTKKKYICNSHYLISEFGCSFLTGTVIWNQI